MFETKKLHIAILDFDDIRNPLLAAGQAKATYEVGKRVVQKGHSVLVVCARYPGYQDRIEEGIRYQHIGLGTRNIRLNNLIYIVVLPFTVARLKADIILECFTAPISTLCSPLFTKIPVVGLPTSFEADRFAKLYHFPFNWIEQFGAKLYKYFLPYTEYLDMKIRKYNRNIFSHIVPEGVGNEFFEITQKKPRYILYLGRFDMGQKGIDLLLNAFAKIKNQIKYPLVIAGHGPDEQRIKDLIKKLELNEKVYLTGGLYGEKKHEVLAHALFTVMPSRHEGFSLFSLESLASGLPLVTFDIPGFTWTSFKVALKARAFDTDEYARLLLEATDPTLITQMRKDAREFAKTFSWDSVADEFELFFFNILDIEAAKVRAGSESLIRKLSF